jgi:hypothetical protein
MLNVAIEDLNLAKDGSSVAPAKAVFGSVSDLLPTIRVSPFSIRVCRSIVADVCRIQWSTGRIMSKLGLACADVCRALDRGLNGRQADQLTRSVFEAIEQLTT